MGDTLLAASSSKGGGQFGLIILLVLIFGVFYFLMIRPQRNRQRQVVQAQNAVVPGQRVRTTAGMYGTVTAVEDGDVVIEVAPGVEVRYLKRAVMDVLSDAPFDPSAEAAGNGTATDARMRMDGPKKNAPAEEPVDEADAARGGHAAE